MCWLEIIKMKKSDFPGFIQGGGETAEVHEMKFMRNRYDGEGGFTLIEMILVALIILILATMAIASMRRARGAGMETAAQKALKSLAEAEELYYQDNFRFADDWNLLLQRYLPRSYTPADRANGFIRSYSVVFQRVGQPILGTGRIHTQSIYPNFTIYAVPITNQLALRTFRITQDGRVTVY